VQDGGVVLQKTLRQIVLAGKEKSLKQHTLTPKIKSTPE